MGRSTGNRGRCHEVVSYHSKVGSVDSSMLVHGDYAPERRLGPAAGKRCQGMTPLVDRTRRLLPCNGCGAEQDARLDMLFMCLTSHKAA